MRLAEEQDRKQVKVLSELDQFHDCSGLGCWVLLLQATDRLRMLVACAVHT